MLSKKLLTVFNRSSRYREVELKFKFDEVLIIGYLVMVNFMDFKSIQGL